MVETTQRSKKPGFFERSATTIRNFGLGTFVLAETTALLMPPLAAAVGAYAVAGLEISALGELGRRAASGRPAK